MRGGMPGTSMEAPGGGGGTLVRISGTAWPAPPRCVLSSGPAPAISAPSPPVVKFNQLLADSVVLQNAADMTHALRGLAREGYPLRRDEIAQLSPYLRDHIKRFGDYVVDLDEIPAPLSGEMPELLD